MANKRDRMENAPVILLTGGSQGLGFALTAELLQQGGAVGFCARTATAVEAAEQMLKPFGRVTGLVGDIADSAFRQVFVAETLAKYGRIDAIVNNASTLGQVPMPHVLEGTVENDRDVFEVNVFAPLALLRLAAPLMQRQTRSLALTISSDAAIGGYPGWGIYGASKAAMNLLHRTMAAEMPDFQVYSVDPGDMATAMHQAADPDATGLSAPSMVAKQLMPLFAPLFGEQVWPFPSGARLQVQDGNLVEVSR